MVKAAVWSNPHMPGCMSTYARCRNDVKMGTSTENPQDQG